MERLPAPMLARLGPIPTEGEWRFETKFDGFRAAVSTHDGFRVQSRWGKDMTPLLPEFGALPADLILDGELVAFEEGIPHLPLVRARLMNRKRGIPLTFVIFDLLRIQRRWLLDEPFAARRKALEGLGLEGAHWTTSSIFDDGTALFDAVCGHGLEGVVAKPLSSAYRPGARGWVKTKNPDYWRRGKEREAVEWARRKTARPTADA